MLFYNSRRVVAFFMCKDSHAAVFGSSLLDFAIG